MRRPKGEGTVERVGTKFRARKTINKIRVCGALRDTWKEADLDRKSLSLSNQPIHQAPTLSDYIKSLLLGRFGKGPRATAPETWATDESHWRNHISRSELGQMPLDEIRRRDVQEFVDLHTSAKPATIRRIAAVISKALSEAVADELIEVNPATGVRYPKLTERRNRVLRPQETVFLVDPSNQLEAMFLVTFVQGLRRGEVCNIKWEDIRVDPLMLDVRGTKTKESVRTIALCADAYVAMMAQLRTSEYVFPGSKGGAFCADTLSDKWATWRDSKGLDSNIRLQDLRGSSVSIQLENKVDIRTVQEFHGHASPVTTQKSYARSRPELQQGAMQAMSSVLAQARETIGHKNREQTEIAAQEKRAQKGIKNEQFEGEFGLVEMKGFEPSTSAVRLRRGQPIEGEKPEKLRRETA